MLEGRRNVCEEGEGKKRCGMEEVGTLGERCVWVLGVTRDLFQRIPRGVVLGSAAVFRVSTTYS